MFGEKDAKSGGEIDSTNVDLMKPANDTPKEHYIMCPNCENIRLGRLETYIASFFYNRYCDPKYAEIFPIDKRFNYYTLELDCIVCHELHIGLFKLFIYSLLWRASISHHKNFTHFKLQPEVEETLRHTLDIYLKENYKDTIAYYDANLEAFPQFQFNIITPLGQEEATANLVTDPMDLRNGGYVIFLNEFMIIFFTKWDAAKKFDRSSNPGAYPINIGVSTLAYWENMIKNLMQTAFDAYIRNHGDPKRRPR